MRTTSSGLIEVVLHVVTVDLGSTEDDGFVHVVYFDSAQCILALQYLHCLRQHLYNVTAANMTPYLTV